MDFRDAAILAFYVVLSLTGLLFTVCIPIYLGGSLYDSASCDEYSEISKKDTAMIGTSCYVNYDGEWISRGNVGKRYVEVK